MHKSDKCIKMLCWQLTGVKIGIYSLSDPSESQITNLKHSYTQYNNLITQYQHGKCYGRNIIR